MHREYLAHPIADISYRLSSIYDRDYKQFPWQHCNLPNVNMILKFSPRTWVLCNHDIQQCQHKLQRTAHIDQFKYSIRLGYVKKASGPADYWSMGVTWRLSWNKLGVCRSGISALLLCMHLLYSHLGPTSIHHQGYDNSRNPSWSYTLM